MATVYKAYDTRLERDVAIKVIRMENFAPSVVTHMLKRFEREVKSLARLSHPNILKVLDFGEYQGAPYLVMEYLPGFIQGGTSYPQMPNRQKNLVWSKPSQMWWCPRRDSNPKPFAPQADALSN